MGGGLDRRRRLLGDEGALADVGARPAARDQVLVGLGHGRPVDVLHVFLGEARQVARLERVERGELLVEVIDLARQRGVLRQRLGQRVRLVERHDVRIAQVRSHRVHPFGVDASALVGKSFAPEMGL